MKRLALYLLSALAIGTGVYAVTSTGERSEEVLVAPQEQISTDAGSKNPSCSLIEGMPILENPEAVRCTNNGSQRVVINIWDQDHENPKVQDRVKRTIEEVVDKWGVKLVAREGFHGLEKSLSQDEKPSYSLSHLEQNGVINIGVDPLYGFWDRLLGIEIDSWSVLEEARKQAETCYEKEKSDNCYKIGRHEKLKSLTERLKKEVGRLNPLEVPDDIRKLSNLSMFLWGLSDYVAHPLRSYAATEGIVSVMEGYDVDRGVLSYGAAHALQINGYLDHLGISHIDIILDEDFFDKRMEGLSQSEMRIFSLKGLEGYKKKVAGKSFD